MAQENPFAGEVALLLDGQEVLCRLTLGALARMEAGPGGLIDLVRRFEEGRYSGADVLAVLLAGLRGAGWGGTAEALGAAQIGGGLTEAVRVAGLLLARAFALPDAPSDGAV